MTLQSILFDFDGVILESNDVRERGFREVLASFPEDQVAGLLDFHRANGGLSRFVKFRHFFEAIRGESVTEREISRLADEFSEVMRQSLCNRALLIQDSLEFLQRAHRECPLHVVSGSAQDELQFLCGRLGIAEFFRSIEGSPTPKIELVANLISRRGYDPRRLVLVGDSHNDLDAARHNDVWFFGYNNHALAHLGDAYLDTFERFEDAALTLDI